MPSVTTNVKKVQSKSQLVVVDIKDLNVDTSYQRDLLPLHRKIAGAFNEEALGIPLVGQREDGSLWTVDGQQRIGGLGLLNRTKVRVELFKSDGPEHEAAVFKLVNMHRIRLTPLQMFKAMLTAHDEMAWEINETVEKLGLHIREQSGSQEAASTSIACINTLISFWKLANKEGLGGKEVVRFTCATAKEAWPDDKLAFNSRLVGGLCRFWLNAQGVVDEARLLERLKRVTPHRILFTAAQLMMGSKEFSVAQIIGQLYTKKLKGGKKTKKVARPAK